MVSGFDAKLVSKSSLTPVQTEVILLRKQVMNGTINATEAAKMRVRRTSLGSYYRVLGQARRNIVESIFTLLVATNLETVKVDELKRLLDFFTRTRVGVDQHKSEQVLSLVEELVRKIVML